MSRGETAARGVVSAGLFAGAGLLVAAQARVRQAEASVAGAATRSMFGVDTMVNALRPVIHFPVRADGSTGSFWIGLTVSQECTVAWLLVPLLVLSGLFAFGRRFAIRAVVLAVFIAAVALSVVNVVRLVVIVMATHLWGLGTGYRWSHDIYGSLISIAGALLATVLFVKLVTRLTKRGNLVMTPATVHTHADSAQGVGS